MNIRERHKLIPRKDSALDKRKYSRVNVDIYVRTEKSQNTAGLWPYMSLDLEPLVEFSNLMDGDFSVF